MRRSGELSETPREPVEHIAEAALEAMRARALELGVEIEQGHVLLRLTDRHATTAATGEGEITRVDLLLTLLHHAKALAEGMGMDFIVGSTDEWMRKVRRRRSPH